jgi:hypothetical protein
MFIKPSEHDNASPFSVNEDFWNRIAKFEPFFARSAWAGTIKIRPANVNTAMTSNETNY